MRQYPRLVGVTGKAGCGKDLVAGFLRTRFGYYQEDLATPIKDAINAMFNLTPAAWSREYKEKAIPGTYYSPRMLAQTLGTEWGRNTIDKDIWVRLLAERWYQLQIDGETQGRSPAMVVSDVRFDNEANWIQKNGGVVIRLDRPNVQDVRSHASEGGVHEHYIDAIVDNDSCITTVLKRFDAKLNRLARCAAGLDIEWYE